LNHPVRIFHVLVVEDNSGDIGLIHQILGQDPHVLVQYSVNAVRARAFLMKQHPYRLAPTPDLVLLDLNLPILPGSSLLPLIKQDPALQRIKVVVLTASHRDSDRAACYALGADDYVVKPMMWPEWVGVITGLLAKHTPAPGSGQAAPADMPTTPRARKPASARIPAPTTSIFLKLDDGRCIALKEGAEPTAAAQLKTQLEQLIKGGMTLSVANVRGQIEDIVPTRVLAIDSVDLEG
jgi:CheY-like chemotaxis protein